MARRKSNKIQASLHGLGTEIQRSGITRENKDLQNLRSKWIPFFKDSNNVYINDLAKRKRRSPTHGAVLKSKAVYSVGEGLAFRQDGELFELSDIQQDYFNEVNDRGESLDDIFTKLILDIELPAYIQNSFTFYDRTIL